MSASSLPVLGSFCLSNTASVNIHQFDWVDDRVLASLNSQDPQWYFIQEHRNPDTDEYETGFYFGSLFVPFSQVLRVQAGGPY